MAKDRGRRGGRARQSSPPAAPPPQEQRPQQQQQRLALPEPQAQQSPPQMQHQQGSGLPGRLSGPGGTDGEGALWQPHQQQAAMQQGGGVHSAPSGPGQASVGALYGAAGVLNLQAVTQASRFSCCHLHILLGM